ncbi:betaine/carnitine/choline transporter (BCCT) family transporter [Corynebacterium otitidis ATCC 51513]|uniref:Betaine/carnitine/choline transporter (BCCT) family transporter n=2 Tax=Corynebacterium otitidis TaxID=29321 RepID=I7LB88_9CORY|nr:betaine/carnitine/choline transporter (BCCT) family transporter [Corynebacterium otitidis ATCC 51513]CCI82889.1 Glycine betaine transporter betP [Corynebacterium otitidis ATCC 51513]
MSTSDHEDSPGEKVQRSGDPDSAASARQIPQEQAADTYDPSQQADSPFPETATTQLSDMIDGREDITEHVHDTDDIALESEDTKHAPINWIVTGVAAVVALAVVLWGTIGSESFSTVADATLGFVLDKLGWSFVLFSTIFVAFVIVIALSHFGPIKLGRSDEEPEFRTISWIAMMFAAGMGIGLMFFGAAEPLEFYLQGVPGHEPGDVESAMASAMFHWTLHPWAIYAIVGLAIAYSTFRIGRRQLVSSAFTPLIGERLARGWLGQLIDILSIIATIFGTACSLGLGTLQISAGLSAAGLVNEPTTFVIAGIIGVLTLAFLLSALSGVGRGIQWISNFNMIVAALLAIFVFVVGPTVAMLDLLPSSIGAYLSQFFEMASRTNTTSDAEWLGTWTVFYWAWWISWSPFVGMFLARVSRGRTIREFCFGVLLIPAGLSTVWFAIFGGAAITGEAQGQDIYGDGVAEEQLFDLLHTMPGGFVAGLLAVLLLATFFITSADSASTVMGSLSQSGRVEATPWVSAAWGLIAAAVGFTLLISGGGDQLDNLQNVTIVAATPFLLIVILLMFAIVKDLRSDVIYADYREQRIFNRKLARERRIHRELQERKSNPSPAQRLADKVSGQRNK